MGQIPYALGEGGSEANPQVQRLVEAQLLPLINPVTTVTTFYYYYF